MNQPGQVHRLGRTRLGALLEAGQPVMLQVDMGFLPYLHDLPERYHFGYHVITVGGYDLATRRVLVADRDLPLHPVSLEDLARARGSTYRPFPPRHTWYTFDFAGRRSPRPEEIHQAIREVCRGMLAAPIANLGVRGIRKAAAEVSRWPARMDEASQREACANAFALAPLRPKAGGEAYMPLALLATRTGFSGAGSTIAGAAGAATGWSSVPADLRVSVRIPSTRRVSRPARSSRPKSGPPN